MLVKKAILLTGIYGVECTIYIYINNSIKIINILFTNNTIKKRCLEIPKRRYREKYFDYHWPRKAEKSNDNSQKVFFFFFWLGRHSNTGASDYGSKL